MVSCEEFKQDTFEKREIGGLKFLYPNACLSPKVTVATVFFSNPTLQRLIKMYKLEDGSQASLEKGLRQAVANNRLADVKEFLTVVNNLNTQDPNPETKRTALHWAAIKGHAECYELLLKNGAKTDAVDAQNKMPEDYILERLEALHSRLVDRNRR